MSNEITIVIADDHPIYRKGLWQILEATPGLRVVGAADNGAAALELIHAHRPRVAMLNPDMPGKDGFDVTRTIVEMRMAGGSGLHGDEQEREALQRRSGPGRQRFCPQRQQA